jgi:acyl-CoA thioester hydrolase
MHPMQRLRLDPPATIHHTVDLRVRVTDINYGRHLGHMELIGLIHEARMQLFEGFGAAEFDVDGLSLVVTELQATYASEALHGQTVRIDTQVVATGRSAASFRSELTDAASGRSVAVVHVGAVFVERATDTVRALPATIRRLTETTA